MILHHTSTSSTGKVGHVKKGKGTKKKTVLEKNQNYSHLSHYSRATFLKKYERGKTDFLKIKSNLSISENR